METTKKLILLKRVPNDKYSHKRGLFKCYCGKEFIALLYDINRGQTKSCGCLQRRKVSELAYKHGGTDTRLHEIWSGIHKRCNNPNADAYKNYGGRGITVCKEWEKDFIPFRDWALSNGYQDHLTIDRENNDGNYEPDNCRWVTQKIQCINQRISKNNKSGHLGVWKTPNGKYTSAIAIDKKRKCLGRFNTPEEASEAYQKAKKERDELYLKREGL